MQALYMKRATDMRFRDPRELTPASYTLNITNLGQALDMKGGGAFKIKNVAGCTFGSEKRFSSMNQKIKVSKRIPGPGQYDINQLLDRQRRGKPCSTIFQKAFIKNECFYDVINGSLVLQPSTMPKKERKLLDEETQEMLRKKPHAKRMGLGFVYQQSLRIHTPLQCRPQSAQPLEQKIKSDHWTSRLARRSNNYSRRFSASVTENKKPKKQLSETETKEPTVKFNTNIDDIDLGASDIDLTATNANKFSEHAMLSQSRDGELMADDTRNSTSKMDDTTNFENTAIMSRSQQTLLPSKTSSKSNILRASFPGLKVNSGLDDYQEGTKSMEKINSVNKITENKDQQSIKIQNPTPQYENHASRNKVSPRLYFSERPTSATNSKTAAKNSTKSQTSNLPQKKLKQQQLQKRRRTHQVQLFNSRIPAFDRDRGYFRDILSTNSYVEYNLQHPVNLSLSNISSPDMEKPFLASSSDRY